MLNIFWGPFALGLFIGMVGTVIALFSFMMVECVEYELFKDVHKARTDKDLPCVLSGRSCEAKPEAAGEEGGIK